MIFHGYLTEEAMAQTGLSKRNKLDGLLVTSLVRSCLKLAGYNGMESVWETLENLQMFSVSKAEVIQTRTVTVLLRIF